MNGILHGCSHNNSPNTDDDGVLSTTSNITKEEICTNVFYYLERVVGDLAQPKQLVYMAIDGVAPRAKLNQQRSRRYRSGTEGELEQSIYELHMSNKQKEEEKEREKENTNPFGIFGDDYTFAVDDDDDDMIDENEQNPTALKEGSPGRFKGKFQTQAQLEVDEKIFHSNVITPGTPFFQYFTQELEKFVRRKLAHDPKWKDLTIIFSGPNVPGEGEHKIMDFMREQQQRSDYDPNLRHCIMGQDGDLIMLGLCTHEPNLVLLRERVIFNLVKRRLIEAHSQSLDAYIHNSHFEFLHMGVLRDYLSYEFETSNVLPSSPWDIERTIDDFVLMTCKYFHLMVPVLKSTN
jgi:5'-3' exonuclease